jgi:carbamate kinase
MGVLVIAAGGGGIPVVREEDRLRGIEAVIDKDLAAALLADWLDAQWLIILTDVPCAYRHFGTERQSPLGRISAAEARSLIDEGHFASGSMRPKMEAAVRFAGQSGRQVLICDLPNLDEALAARAGTIIESD